MKISLPDQRTFSQEHLERVAEVFAGSVDTADAGIIYRASYSESFAEDLRAVMREIFTGETIREWVV